MPVCANSVHAKQSRLTTSPKVLACIAEAARIYEHDPDLLRAIAETESSLRPHVIGHLAKNGSFDIGLMQINSSWLPFLKKRGIAVSDLFDPCVNARVGAFVLWDNQKRLGKTWKAVGAYNAAKNVAQQHIYVSKVWKKFRQIKEAKGEIA